MTAPKPEAACDEGESLGARLRRRRRVLGLRLIDAASLLAVDAKTLMFWERDERPPVVSAYPAIIRYLRAEPWSEPETLGDALLAERRRRGGEIRKAAALAGVDEGTWRRWEHGEWKPTRLTLPALDQLLGVATHFPADVR
jgi:transcriptional regulator with XRE-family HTH domain